MENILGSNTAGTVFRFKTRDAAWSFMAACDDAGIQAGYPSYGASPTVEIEGASLSREELALTFGGTFERFTL